MPVAGTDNILAGLPISDLEAIIVQEHRSAMRCRLAKATEEAELHADWRDMVLEEWARRQPAVDRTGVVPTTRRARSEERPREELIRFVR
jgi:hypothetical protein